MPRRRHDEDLFRDINEDKRRIGKLIKRLQILRRDLRNENYERAMDVQAAIDEIYHIFRVLDDTMYYQTVTDAKREINNILRNYGLTRYVKF
jgi:hypothetical protein